MAKRALVCVYRWNFCGVFGAAAKVVDLVHALDASFDVAQVSSAPSFVLGRNQGRMNVVRVRVASRRAV
jgi:hypothetical protein